MYVCVYIHIYIYIYIYIYSRHGYRLPEVLLLSLERKQHPKSLPKFLPLGIVVRFRTVVILTFNPKALRTTTSEVGKTWNSRCRRILGSELCHGQFL